MWFGERTVTRGASARMSAAFCGTQVAYKVARRVEGFVSTGDSRHGTSQCLPTHRKRLPKDLGRPSLAVPLVVYPVACDPIDLLDRLARMLGAIRKVQRGGQRRAEEARPYEVVGEEADEGGEEVEAARVVRRLSVSALNAFHGASKRVHSSPTHPRTSP